jgi:tetratricopeptide (TPR) repeat protein
MRYFSQTRVSAANKSVKITLAAALAVGLLANCSVAQTSKKPATSDATASAQRGLQLAEQGLCSEALPVLRKAIPHIVAKKMRYDVEMATAQCGMSIYQEDAIVDALVLLRREFPRDPKVLYTATHFYSELASRAAQELAATAPTSAEAQELDAEGLESHGKLDEAAAEYRKILEKYPGQLGIHYRLGRIILAEPATATTAEDAKKEFEAELQIDPGAASAEFMLGDLARQAQQWDEAIDHFSRAAKLDAGFSEAYLGLGLSLNAAGKNSDAISPLEKYVKMVPEDPAGHYQLAIAYARTGRQQDAQREIALQHEAEKKAPPNGPQDPGQQ